MDQPARQELLLASNHAQLDQLSEPSQLYIEAVRATTVRDYPAATRQYQSLLDAAPPDEQASALEDLGRALQRARRLPEAIAAYRRAAELQPTNAGVQLHLGILAGLERKQPAANAYLDRATQLYDASTNQEGKAEVDYQRACMAYVRADYKSAEAFYSDSLDLAVKLDDLQMQARALGGLSTVLRWDGDLAGSTAAANRENALGDRLNSDFWQAEATMHLANLAIVRKDVPQARALLTQALELAHRAQQPRILANAEFSIADLADQTGDYAQELTYAQHARDHYQSYGSADGVADASLQIVQAERGLRNYPAALRDANALLENSNRTGSDLFAEDTEAELGHIYTATGDHGTALDHYQRSLALAHKTGSQVPLKTLHVVCALTQLGRLPEARKLFATVPTAARQDPDCQKRYNEALAMLQHPPLNKSEKQIPAG